MASPKTYSQLATTLIYCLCIVVAAKQIVLTRKEEITESVLYLASAVEQSNKYLPTPESIQHRRLYETHECPLNPKPTCEELSCQGSITLRVGTAFEQYTCSNQSPVNIEGFSESVILAHCRCCPRQLVSCTDTSCAAVPETARCIAEPLHGCLCQTQDTDGQLPTDPDQQGRGSGPYLQPNYLPPSSGDNILRMIGEFHQMGIFITRDETNLQLLEEAGIDRPRAEGVIPNTLAPQESVAEYIPHLPRNASDDVATDQAISEHPDFTRTLGSFQIVLPTALGGCGTALNL